MARTTGRSMKTMWDRRQHQVEGATPMGRRPSVAWANDFLAVGRSAPSDAGPRVERRGGCGAAPRTAPLPAWGWPTTGGNLPGGEADAEEGAPGKDVWGAGEAGGWRHGATGGTGWVCSVQRIVPQRTAWPGAPGRGASLPGVPGWSSRSLHSPACRRPPVTVGQAPTRSLGGSPARLEGGHHDRAAPWLSPSGGDLGTGAIAPGSPSTSRSDSGRWWPWIAHGGLRRPVRRRPRIPGRHASYEALVSDPRWTCLRGHSAPAHHDNADSPWRPAKPVLVETVHPGRHRGATWCDRPGRGLFLDGGM